MGTLLPPEEEPKEQALAGSKVQAHIGEWG